ncbi:MAG: glycogen debranching N-terminal domain-containing protein [Alkalispirochaeta sp.]
MLDTTPVPLNSQNNLVLKEDRTYWVADPFGIASSPEHGIYHGDTRVLSDFRWISSRNLTLLRAVPLRPDRIRFHMAVMRGPDQMLSVVRDVATGDGVVRDAVSVTNYQREEIEIDLRFTGSADFTDLFVVRGFPTTPAGTTEQTVADHSITFDYRNERFSAGTRVTVTGPGATIGSEAAQVDARFRFRLAPGATQEATVQIDAWSAWDRSRVPTASLPTYAEWEGSVPTSVPERLPEVYRNVFHTAVRDIRGLLLATEDGPFPAAGIPWYVAVFGRDALITAHFLLPWRRDIAIGVLRHLARHQGTTVDGRTEEEPGKILHELRDGALAAIGVIPHRPYYGTVDATALFVMLVAETDDPDVMRELQLPWERALRWIREYGDPDGDGFVEFNSGGGTSGGTVVQSWKDSHDSMSHADGVLASGLVAGAEVQGYSYAAFRAAATMYARLGEHEKAREWNATADRLADAFDKAFWNEGLGSYAMALDGKKEPLLVHSSNAGQLLWTGIVREDRVPRLVAALFSRQLWSGWGIRTLGTGARRYNPVSYHNGSVWPHDTAIVALGLQRYGYHDEADRIARALYDLAAGEDDLRLPELVAGYPRDDGPPVPYPVACRPQAWDAAALIALAFTYGHR